VFKGIKNEGAWGSDPGRVGVIREKSLKAQRTVPSSGGRGGHLFLTLLLTRVQKGVLSDIGEKKKRL